MLNDARIRNTKPGALPVKLTDGKGLYLEVRPSGTKLWRYRYRVGGKENVFAIGEYPAVGLAKARAQRDAARELVRQGIHPAHERKLERIRTTHENANTFEAVMREWIAGLDWAPSTKRNRMPQIEMHLLPHLGAMPVRQITPAHVLDVLRRAERKEADTRERKRGANTRMIGGGSVVRRLRQIVSGTFDHAVATLRAESNPAGPIRRAFKTAKTTHKTPLTPPQIGEFLRALDAYHGSFMTAAALRLLWLTVARPSEVVGARWVEFDLDGEIWKIPAARMKSREDHAIPLPAHAVELLRRLSALSGTREFVFPHRDRRDSPMTYDALNKGIGRMGLTFKTTPHASRTTASTMLNELGFRHDVIERQLAHQERNAVRRAYNRAEYLSERREMMRQWADMLDAWRDRTKVLPPRTVAA